MLFSEIKEILVKNSNGLFPEKYYEETAQDLYDLFNDDPKNYTYVYYLRIVGTSLVKFGIARTLRLKLLELNQSSNNKLQLDGFIYGTESRKIYDLTRTTYHENRTSSHWYNIPPSDVEEIMKDYNGHFIQAKIDEQLVIQDGQVLNYNKYKKEIPRLTNFIHQGIKNFLIENNLNQIELTVQDLQKYIIKDKSIYDSDVRRELKKYWKSNKTKRYHCFFTDLSRLGRTYIISREDYELDLIVPNQNTTDTIPQQPDTL